ncbi:MAG TPA: imidazole glycerol phosphate synthase subunit HisH [Desulfuromonadales bacterium]|nr:imidazole glycerol phosphate synthase subunit HisH [Desulfuromonadales bacterium]
MPTVTIIDYGIGNLLSVARAFEHCGANVVLTDDPAKIIGADYLVLPGVGAFADGMSGLTKRGLVEPIKAFAVKERPFLGICLGMQLMLDESEEFGANEGLGLIPGKVVAVPSVGINGASHKIPHIGWNEIRTPNDVSWKETILETIPDKSSLYFVHSFTAMPLLHEHRLANCYYNEQLIAATIRKDNLYGCQFHPEKSGQIGLAILRRFLMLG